MGSELDYKVNTAPTFRGKEILIPRLKVSTGVVIFVLKIDWLIFACR